MEALHGKGKGFQEALQDRQQEVLRNALDAAGELVLGDLVDGVDVIDALDLVEVALMHRVDADPARAALRARLAADADRRLRGARHVLGAEHPLVGPRAAQVVQVAVGDPRQALVARVSEDLEGPVAAGPPWPVRRACRAARRSRPAAGCRRACSACGRVAPGPCARPPAAPRRGTS